MKKNKSEKFTKKHKGTLKKLSEKEIKEMFPEGIDDRYTDTVTVEELIEEQKGYKKLKK